VGAETRDVLSRIVATKRAEVEALRPHASEVRARARDAAPTRGFARALRSPGTVRVLAEIKRRSPSAGPIRADADPAAIAAEYQAGGAAALSVLTDREYFDGSLAALAAARGAVDLPLLRKDFIIDPLQIWEARAAGADAILLIVRILTDDQLAELSGLAAELGLDALVEVHDREELARALGSGAVVVGINNRDLKTFTTDLALSLDVAPTVDPAITLVAESGIRSADDVRRLGQAGVDAVLVGESLMRQPDVRVAVAELAGQPKRAEARG
jgi:indole-3-glycerol phosphate synthase